MYVFKDYVVVMKSMKNNGLYILLGKTIFHASNASVSSNFDNIVL